MGPSLAADARVEEGFLPMAPKAELIPRLVVASARLKPIGPPVCSPPDSEALRKSKPAPL